MEPLRVLTLADSRYAMPLAVMVRSLLETRAPGDARPLELTVIDGGLTPADRERLALSWRDAPEFAAAAIRYVPPDFGDWLRALPVWGRVPLLTYARLLLEAFYPGGEGRVTLLDSDTVVASDLAELHDTPLGGHVLGACVDPFIPVVSARDGLATWREAGLAPTTPYFNAGVMTIDLGAWRRERIGERALAYLAREHRRLRQYDQDGLNAVSGGRWQALDSRWQAQPRAGNALGQPWPAKPGVIHFSGRLKPWSYAANHPADRLFREVLDRTDWRGSRPAKTGRALAYRLYDTPARRWTHPLEKAVTAWRREREQARGGERAKPGNGATRG